MYTNILTICITNIYQHASRLATREPWDKATKATHQPSEAPLSKSQGSEMFLIAWRGAKPLVFAIYISVLYFHKLMSQIQENNNYHTSDSEGAKLKMTKIISAGPDSRGVQCGAQELPHGQWSFH